MTALVYSATAMSIAMPQPLGVWHMGDAVSFVVAILCGPYIGMFSCGVGAMLFDIWNPIWGSSFLLYAPVTLLIRAAMGFLVGKFRLIFHEQPAQSEIIIMILASAWKNLCYFLYDFYLFGSIAFLDLTTFFPLSAISIILTVVLLISVRRTLKTDYLFSKRGV